MELVLPLKTEQTFVYIHSERFSLSVTLAPFKAHSHRAKAKILFDACLLFSDFFRLFFDFFASAVTFTCDESVCIQ